ncbi:MAG: GGDEF domain-containing protein, partial [Planctomycetes bacterium]|nr:GGDEF domain-containing protein [Planctomycetota bacterium]
MDQRPTILIVADGDRKQDSLARALLDQGWRVQHGRAPAVEARKGPRSPRSPQDRIAALELLIAACRSLSELERDREELLTQALEFFMEVTSSRRASMFLRGDQPGKLQMVRRTGFPEGLTGPISMHLGQDLAGIVSAEGEPLIIEMEPRSSHRPDRGYEGCSCLIVPLKSKRTTIGVVNLTNRTDGGVYDQDDLANAVVLAEQAAVTLNNAQALADLHGLTVIDPLTQLYNRRHFDRELKKELERARRHGRRLTLVLMDIDRFKSFNDINGYLTGDSIIRRVGAILQSSFRETDVVTRWGGDEFAILLPDANRPGPEESPAQENYIERVRLAIESADHSNILPGENLRITMSVGVASFPQDA